MDFDMLRKKDSPRDIFVKEVLERKLLQEGLLEYYTLGQIDVIENLAKSNFLSRKECKEIIETMLENDNVKKSSALLEYVYQLIDKYNS
jgi:hypothetical protein